MTTYQREVRRCVVCGEVATLKALASTSAFGPCDLDLRPPSPQRHTMGFWQQECSGCGYVNVTLNTRLPEADAVVGSPEFIALRAATDEPALVNRFKRYALLVNEPRKAGWALLHAAWVYDDFGDWERAARCRHECADMWSASIGGTDEESLRLQTVLIDVLRRAECFDEADLLLRQTSETAKTLIMTKVLDFQRRLIAVYDVDIYTVEQAAAAYRTPDILKSRSFLRFGLR